MHSFELTISRSDGLGRIYLEVTVGMIVFILMGRYFEKRSKRSAGAALRALLELGAKGVAILRDGQEHRVPIEEFSVGTNLLYALLRRSPPMGRSPRAPVPSMPPCMLTSESVPVEVGPGDAVTGATVNAGGRLVVRVSNVGSDTQLARRAERAETAYSGTKTYPRTVQSTPAGGGRF